jgi:hypothetical protein
MDRCIQKELDMHISKIMFAIVALTAGQAMATTATANIAISSGASASKNNLKLVLAAKCSATLAEYRDGTNNASTYVCATGTFSATPTAAEYAASTPVNFTGSTFAELRLNVNGGSFTAVCLLAGWPANSSCPAADLYVDPASTTPNASGALSAPASSGTTIGGLMDIEPNGFGASVRTNVPNAPSVVSAQFGQTFGVAVSNSLYTSMFNYQQSAGILPPAGVCAVSDTNRAECVPVIGKAQMATVMSGNTSSAFYTNGAAFLAPGFVSTNDITYARRVDTSGTQASAQQYFLGNVCSTASVSVVPAGQSQAPVTVTALPTTGGVRGLLNGSANVIGVMSGENNQAENWKWLRIGGMQMSENAAPGNAAVTNTATALDGRYDFWFLSRVAKPAVIPANAAVTTFWNSVIIPGFGQVAAGNTKGLFKTSETSYQKGSTNSCLPASI